MEVCPTRLIATAGPNRLCRIERTIRCSDGVHGGAEIHSRDLCAGFCTVERAKAHSLPIRQGEVADREEMKMKGIETRAEDAEGKGRGFSRAPSKEHRFGRRNGSGGYATSLWVWGACASKRPMIWKVLNEVFGTNRLRLLVSSSTGKS